MKKKIYTSKSELIPNLVFDVNPSVLPVLRCELVHGVWNPTRRNVVVSVHSQIEDSIK